MSDLETYARMLRPNKHALDDALEEQAEVQYRIAEHVELLESKLDLSTELLKKQEASLFSQRKTAGDADKLAGENVRLDPRRTPLWEGQQRLRLELGQWKALYESWKARGYSIKDLVALYSAQYFTVGPNSSAPRPARTDYSERRGRGTSPPLDERETRAATPRRRIG